MGHSVEDLEIYTSDRFKFAKLIAISWFDILETIPGILSTTYLSDIQLFKKELEDRTIVGEYCGNIHHQHLVKYNKINIIWFAITQFGSD